MTDDPCDDVTPRDIFRASTVGLVMDSMSSKIIVAARVVDDAFNAHCARQIADAWLPS